MMVLVEDSRGYTARAPKKRALQLNPRYVSRTKCRPQHGLATIILPW